MPFIGPSRQEANPNPSDDINPTSLLVVGKEFNRKKPFYVDDDNVTRLVIPRCCRAIPGDDALGFIDNKNHIELHRRDCPVADRLKSSFGNRIIDIKWNMHRRTLFDASIRVCGIDRIGLLNEVTGILSQQLNVNIQKLTISTKDGVFDGTIELKVYERSDVKVIIDALSSIQNLEEIKEIQ